MKSSWGYFIRLKEEQKKLINEGISGDPTPRTWWISPEFGNQCSLVLRAELPPIQISRRESDQISQMWGSSCASKVISRSRAQYESSRHHVSTIMSLELNRSGLNPAILHSFIYSLEIFIENLLHLICLFHIFKRPRNVGVCFLKKEYKDSL